jgi:hypothetical protein
MPASMLWLARLEWHAELGEGQWQLQEGVEEAGLRLEGLGL